MYKLGFSAAVSAVFWAAGCTYQSTAPISAAYDVYSNYSETIPGRFALYVDAEKANEVFKVDGFACSAHKYEINAEQAFRVSTLNTFTNLVEEIQIVSVPLTREDMATMEYTGLIHVVLEDMDASLKVIPGFWSAEMEADVEFTASLKVDATEGRVLGTTVEADEDEKADAGGACEGGAEAVSRASASAMKELMQRLGERLANSQRVRALSSRVANLQR